jgi:hypothetical protein
VSALVTPERPGAPVDRFFVHYYDPKRRGTWIAKFETREAADKFAVGKRVWGKPSVVRPIEELGQ